MNKSNPLADLPEDERDALTKLAERKGWTLEEAKKRHDEVARIIEDAAQDNPEALANMTELAASEDALIHAASMTGADVHGAVSAVSLMAKGDAQTEAVRDGANVTNERYQKAKAEARKQAVELIETDAEQEYQKADLLEWIGGELERVGLYRPTDRKLWDWLKEEPSIIPDYITRPGRRTK